MKASLLSRMYRSSVAGKPEESGTAMELLPSIESSVTEYWSIPPSSGKAKGKLRTYIIIAIFHQEGYSLAVYRSLPS